MKLCVGFADMFSAVQGKTQDENIFPRLRSDCHNCGANRARSGLCQCDAKRKIATSMWGF